MTAYHVLDANQPNPDKLIADAARNARLALWKAYNDENVSLTYAEEAFVLHLLTLLDKDHELNGPQL